MLPAFLPSSSFGSPEPSELMAYRLVCQKVRAPPLTAPMGKMSCLPSGDQAGGPQNAAAASSFVATILIVLLSPLALIVARRSFPSNVATKATLSLLGDQAPAYIFNCQPGALKSARVIPDSTSVT